ncbi:hypothetical protein SCL_1623 [Sulfuricaulis limicola]|uniref:Uncharacterized protein n=1 Tax=Sulfuricaulis limicola TaxID=1620215 RepID=A0A1B4XGJ1_9GAMM|nr:hypothetical protein [Sulfuricaulis limicola]BAV33928.1 hypothetical protein SCL_1623 [Sulfuricaulis limicola]
MTTQIIMRAIIATSLGILATPVLFPPAYAEEWFMAPLLRLSYEQNDNYRLTLQPHNTVQGTIIAPRLDMGVRSEVWDITGSAEVARARYSGEPGLDRDFQTFRLASLFRTERSNFTINASRVNDASISGDQQDSDLGLATTQKSRRTENIQPVWSWIITERAQLQLGYQFSKVSYVDGESVGLYNYQSRAATATLSYLVSPLTKLFFTANYSKYRVPDANYINSIAFDGALTVVSTVTDVESRTPAFRMGVNHNFSETMQGTLAFGRRKTETERITSDCLYVFNSLLGCFPGKLAADNTGTIFSGDLTKKYEKLNITASASRDLAASGSATQVDTDTLYVQLGYPFASRFQGILTATGVNARSISDTTATATDTNRRYYSIEPKLVWQWTRDADLDLTYRYFHLKRENEAQAVQARVVSLTLNYTWPRFSVSR